MPIAHFENCPGRVRHGTNRCQTYSSVCLKLTTVRHPKVAVRRNRNGFPLYNFAPKTFSFSTSMKKVFQLSRLPLMPRISAAQQPPRRVRLRSIRILGQQGLVLLSSSLTLSAQVIHLPRT